MLIHGPADIATVAFVARHIPEAIVSAPEEEQLKQWLLELHQSAEKRHELADACRSVAVSEFGISERREKLDSHIAVAINMPYRKTIRYHERKDGANLDESALVSFLTQENLGPEFVMLDVGAHHGSSAKHFASSGWTIFRQTMEVCPTLIQ